MKMRSVLIALLSLLVVSVYLGGCAQPDEELANGSGKKARGP